MAEHEHLRKKNFATSPKLNSQTAQTTKTDCLLQDQYQAPVMAEQGIGREANWLTQRKYVISFLGSCVRGSRLNTAHSVLFQANKISVLLVVVGSAGPATTNSTAITKLRR